MRRRKEGLTKLIYSSSGKLRRRARGEGGGGREGSVGKLVLSNNSNCETDIRCVPVQILQDNISVAQDLRLKIRYAALLH